MNSFVDVILLKIIITWNKNILNCSFLANVVNSLYTINIL